MSQLKEELQEMSEKMLLLEYIIGANSKGYQGNKEQVPRIFWSLFILINVNLPNEISSLLVHTFSKRLSKTTRVKERHYIMINGSTQEDTQL